MKRSFVYLVAVTLAALLVLFFSSPNEQAPEQDEALLMAGVAARINDVDRVEIIAAGPTPVASLSRSDDAWVVEDMAGYRADWPRLQTLLAALATARVVETKTDKPEYYARLGVEDVSAEDAGSILVRLGIGADTSGVLIGNRAQGRQGQYVRLEGVAASALVDKTFDVPATTLEWVDTRIIDVNSSEVAEVELIHPDMERVLVTRVSADQTDFDLAGLPEGREIKSSWSVNSLASVLSMLNLESVRADSGEDWDGAVKMRILLFSGMEIMAEINAQQDEYWLRLHAIQTAEKNLDAGNNEPAGNGAEALEVQAANDVAAAVEDINRKTAGWVYGISKQKYEAMAKRTEDLLKPLEDS